MKEFILQLIYMVPVILISMTFHEFSHAFVATKLGDPTPKSMGRYSLNPMHHLDIFGTLSLLVFRFGWAKPVQVNPYYFRGNKKAGMAMVAVAGPLSNLILALISSFFYVLFAYKLGSSPYIVFFFELMLFVNIGLAIFNLIPVPPLDGYRVLSYFFPGALNNLVGAYEDYGLIVLILLLSFRVLTGPLSLATSAVVGMFEGLAMLILGIR